MRMWPISNLSVAYVLKSELLFCDYGKCIQNNIQISSYLSIHFYSFQILWKSQNLRLEISSKFNVWYVGRDKYYVWCVVMETCFVGKQITWHIDVKILICIKKTCPSSPTHIVLKILVWSCILTGKLKR